MRLSVDIHSAVRFRNAEALRGDNLGYMSRISQASQERPKTSRKAAAEERSDELPLRDVYNEWNGLDLELRCLKSITVALPVLYLRT